MDWSEALHQLSVDSGLQHKLLENSRYIFLPNAIELLESMVREANLRYCASMDDYNQFFARVKTGVLSITDNDVPSLPSFPTILLEIFQEAKEAIRVK